MCEWTGCPGVTLHTLSDSHLVLQPNDIAQPCSASPSFKLEQVASTSQLHPPEQLHLPEQPHLPPEQREKLPKQLQLPANNIYISLKYIFHHSKEFINFIINMYPAMQSAIITTSRTCNRNIFVLMKLK